MEALLRAGIYINITTEKNARNRTHIRAVLAFENKQFDECRSRRGKNEACMLRMSSQDSSIAIGFFE